MVTGVAFVPQAPALVPDVGRGLDAELGPLRDACRTAIARVVTPDSQVAVLGGTPGYDVASWLLADPVRSDTPDALVVLGDGSARRSEKAPGYLDERSGRYDEGIAGALRSGDPARLAALDAALGRDLLAAGVPAWHEAAAATSGTRFTAELLYVDAPFGVGYFVAVWTRAEH